MHVAHSLYREPAVRVVMTKRLTPDQERAEIRLAQRMEKDKANALIEFSTEVKEIREYQPDWMPGDKIK